MIQRLLFFLLLSSSCLFAQKKPVISGTVTDSSTKETLPGVTVYIAKLNLYTETNAYGYYVLNVPEGMHQVRIQYFGYQDAVQEINIQKDTRIDFQLELEMQFLEEIVVTANSSNRTDIRKAEMSANKLTAAEIKKMPVVLGEPDVLKSILQLPGVANAGEASSGFNVRGGASDQNLLLMDEATLFTASHLYGFVSVFNNDVVKDMKLYKGGIPARYGGRLSSVLDIYQKEGNRKTHHLSGGIGVLSSRLLAEGPLQNEKASYLIAGRASYAHLFLKLQSDNKNSAYFYDLNAKLNYELNENNSLFLSGYFGRDFFDIGSNFTNTYGNSFVNLRWNHVFSPSTYSNLSAIYSDYYYGFDLEYVGFTWDSGIKNYQLKYDIRHFASNRFKFNTGINAIYHRFNPGDIQPLGEDSGINPLQLDQKYAIEPAAYFAVEQEITDQLSLQYGLRYSFFARMGGQPFNRYANGQAVVYNPDLMVYEKGEPIEEVYYGKSKMVHQFGNFEPRFAMSYVINEQQSVKASYNRMAQYLHLISNTSSATPLDVWAPADNYLKPQILDQYAVGYFRNLADDDYSIEVEYFYKDIKNRLDYIEGADLIANNAIEQVVLPAQARALGLEVLLKKNTGKFTGWISYTLSKSEQRVQGRTAIEPGINNGNWYSTPYDKPHNLAVVAMYQQSKKWSYSANFILQSGLPATFPNGQYSYEGVIVPTYGQRNQDRLSAYHRLDVSASYTPTKNQGRSWQTEWTFGIYNLYNRRNANSYSFRQNEDTAKNEAVRLSIFGIIPSVTYNFKW